MNSTKTIIRRASQAVLAVFLTIAINQVTFGQTQEGSVLLGMTEFTIKPGQNTKFQEGVKAWKVCYLENEGKWNWDMWNRLQGEGNVYVISSISENWAAFDETDEVGQKCRDISRELINPHIECSKYFVARTMPLNSNSKPMGADVKVISVSYWTVKNSVKFMGAVNEVHTAMKEKEGDIRGYWFSNTGGGPDDFHYMAVSSFRNFAQMDEILPGAWVVLESSKGKRQSDTTRQTFIESTDTRWSYIYTWEEELSRGTTGEATQD